MNKLVRDFDPGMGNAVAERTILRPRLTEECKNALGDGLRISPRDPNYFNWLRAAYYSGVTVVDDLSAPARPKPDTVFETWEDVSNRVALGNAMLDKRPTKFKGFRLLGTENKVSLSYEQYEEFDSLQKHIAKGNILLSGRHLQHGDENQPNRNQEVFTNCSTSASSFVLFYLLLNGSGVGRNYTDELILTDWDYAPQLMCVLDESHPDFVWGRHESTRDARHKYGKGKNVIWFEVPDSREGWAKAVERYEVLAFQKVHSHKILVLDFSKVRPKGSPIKGMQMRPSSGPVPLMDALGKVSSLKGAGLDPWHQAIYADHYLAECVLVGGARRAARMSTKHWTDRNVLDFIEVKRPIEYQGLSNEEVVTYRAEWLAAFKRGEKFMPNPPAFLWSSNNSVTVDVDFWRLLGMAKGDVSPEERSDWAHARAVYERLTECAYFDGTGEPGIINVDKLVRNDEGWDYENVPYVGSDRYQPEGDTRLYLSVLARAAHASKFPMIVNPCGEIALTSLGGYCVISDVVPFHADTLDEAEDAFRVSTRALIRVNTMDSLYKREVDRTNRIGVGMTGVHEFAWKFFNVGFRDLVSMSAKQIRKLAADAAHMAHTTSTKGLIEVLSKGSTSQRVAAFWMTLSHFSRAVKDEATRYSKELGVVRPHTDTTIKPAGTTSKLFGLTEGWHLPALAYYLRWVQFKDSDQLVDDYEAKGYPVRRDLKQYRGMVIVGFPTVPTIATLGMGDKLVLAGDATMEEQYAWLALGEHFYIQGIGEDMELSEDTGNQISYTLKYKPELVSFELFQKEFMAHQSSIRACSVMPQEDGSAYEYLPEESVTKAEYERLARAIAGSDLVEDIGLEHISCEGGACPVDFSEK